MVRTILDCAEEQASRRKHNLLHFNERVVLTDGGTVSRAEADQRVLVNHEILNTQRRTKIEAAAERDALTEPERVAKALPKRSARERREEES